MGVFGGEDKLWLNPYIETAIFREASKSIQKRTGLNIEWASTAMVAAHSAKTMIPKTANAILEQMKTQTTSSIALDPTDSTLQTYLLKFIRKQHDGSSKSLLKLRGQHDQRDANGELQPHVGELKRTFRFDGTTFLLDEVKDAEGSDHGVQEKLVIRCLATLTSQLLNSWITSRLKHSHARS